MVTPGSAHSWSDYVERMKDRPPRDLLVEALAFVQTRGAAIDLGAGPLNDSRYLVREDFQQVIALDSAPVAQVIANTLRRDRFTYVISALEDYAFPVAAFDLVSAQFALPFVHPDAFPRVFSATLASLKPGGVFTGQLFGDRDQWRDDPKMNFHAVDEARSLFSGLELLAFREEEVDGPTLTDAVKHWHIIHIIARKPPA